jgi:hypothetical protein
LFYARKPVCFRGICLKRKKSFKLSSYFADVVTGEMSLDQEFYQELSSSSSPEFKNLSTQFCGAVRV